MTIDSCYKCDSEDMHRIEKVLTREIAGHAFRAKVPATRCGNCGEILYESRDLGHFDDAVALALLDGHITAPAAIRFVRKAMGMKGEELAELLGVRPETVSRWENGKREIDRATFVLLRQLLLERHRPEHPTADYLRKLQRPRRLAKTITLKLAS